MTKLFKDAAPRKVNPVDAQQNADVNFIAAGLKAARNSRNDIRATVLDDVSKALDCTPEDLSFLFKGVPEDEDVTIYDFPDSERRRQVIAYNNLDAAE